MALIDVQALFSDDQAITTTASSTNVYDFGTTGYGKGEGVRRAKILCQVTEAFGAASGTPTLTVSVRTGATASPSTVLLSTDAIAMASLVAGYQFTVEVPVPRKHVRYMDLNYTASAAFNAGKITAGLVADTQTNDM